MHARHGGLHCSKVQNRNSRQQGSHKTSSWPNTPWAQHTLHLYRWLRNWRTCRSAFCPTTSDTWKVYLGTEEQFNVFTTEATAFNLTAEIVKESPPNFTKCIIYVDSRAAIKGIVKPQKQSGQSIIISAINKEWDVAWKAAKNDAKQLCQITSKRHTQKGIKLYKAINMRHDVAQLERLRSGHCSLNQYLFRFGHANSPYCKCDNQTIETIQHYLLQCPRYEMQCAKACHKGGNRRNVDREAVGISRVDWTHIGICEENKEIQVLREDIITSQERKHFAVIKS